jgi:bacterioferritin
VVTPARAPKPTVTAFQAYSLAGGTFTLYPVGPCLHARAGTGANWNHPRRLSRSANGKTSNRQRCRPERSSELDKENFIDALNEDLQTEFQSIVQYISHVATVTGAEFLGVIDELKVHLTQELEHAQILAEQIAFLGGEPSTSVPKVERATGRDALAADLQLEDSQLERYRKRFSEAMDLGLADVAEALRPLLEQTQEHVRDLQTALGR